MLTLANLSALSFPRASIYRRGSMEMALHEAPPPLRYFPYRERHLQCLWADPRFRPPQLRTSQGEQIEVEHPGEWNLEEGPDFTGAVLLVGADKRRIRGDLEIHIHAHGWKQHGHAADPNYENVRFHLVYFPGTEYPGLLQIPLLEPLAANPLFSFDHLDLSAYPYSIPAGRAPWQNLHPDEKTEKLECAGEERLRLKAERLALTMQTREPHQVLWEELMASLGYKKNKLPFRKLATKLPLYRLQQLAHTPEEAYALLLGCSGLLPINPDPAWTPASHHFIRTLWDFWWKKADEFKTRILPKEEWNLANIRPANHPQRRLMAAAHYAFMLEDIPFDASWLTTFPANHWNSHMSWKKECSPIALVGRARANTIITNTLIPWRAAMGEEQLDLHHLAPEPINQIIRQTAHALFGPDHSPKVYASALARQGLIQIFHDYLVSHRLEELCAETE